MESAPVALIVSGDFWLPKYPPGHHNDGRAGTWAVSLLPLPDERVAYSTDWASSYWAMQVWPAQLNEFLVKRKIVSFHELHGVRVLSQQCAYVILNFYAHFRVHNELSVIVIRVDAVAIQGIS